jgi:hypothetical protein
MAQTPETFSAGAYIINMGQTPQANGNALKPYGMVYDLIRNYYIPVRWVIGSSKTKDGIDFTYQGTTFRGGTFIIPKELRTTAVNSRISYWQSQGVVGMTTTSSLTVSVTLVLNTVPRWTFIAPKGSGTIAKTYLANGGINLSDFPNAYNWKRPSELSGCDDLFVMPHDEPQWSTHGNLYTWNRTYKGAILVACHTGSYLENMVNPANPSQQTNFLTSTGAVSFKQHKKGTPPYISRLFSDPVAQYMGATDLAHESGSEQIYVPKTTWRSSTKIISYDPTQADVPVVKPDLSNAAAPIVYGRAWGDSTNNCGLVMYEAGHYYKETSPAGVAAQRVFYNFSFYQQLEKSPRIVSGSITGIAQGAFLQGGQTVSLNATAVAGLSTATVATYQWHVSVNGGAYTSSGFSAPASASTNYTLPVAATATPVIISVTITDNCGRTSCYATTITITPPPAPPVAKNDTLTISSTCGVGLPAVVNVLTNDTDPQGSPLTVVSLSSPNPSNAGTWSFTQDGNVTFVPNTDFGGPATIQYTVVNAQGVSATATVVAAVGTPDSHGCYPSQVWGVANSSLLTSTEVASSQGVTIGTGLDDLESDGSAGSYVNMTTNVTNYIIFNLPVTLNSTDTINIYWAKKTVNATPATITVQQGIGGVFSGAVTYSTLNTSLANPTVTKVPITLNGVTQIKINTGTLPSTNSGDSPYIDAVEYEVWSCVSKAPDANSDNYVVAEDDPSTISVLDNDNDPQDLPLTITHIIAAPTKGKLSINLDNTITYVSNRDVNGVDSFAYRVCNTQGYCSEAVATVTIQPDGCSANMYRPIGTTPETTVGFLASKDAWLNQGTLNQKNGGTVIMDVGKKPNNQRRPIIQFDLSSIPTNAIVTNAKLKLTRTGGDANTQTINVHKLTQTWTESQVTWNNAANGSAWTTAGGTYDPAIRSSNNVTGKKMNFYWSLGSLAQEWVQTPSSNMGMLLKANDVRIDKRHSFATKENGPANTWDSLYVSYKLPLPCQAIPNRAPLANPDTTTINSVSPVTINVLSNDVDPDGNVMTLQSIGAVTNGTATKSGNTIVFTPMYGFNGTASVTYTVADNSGFTDQSIAYIVVTNAPPVALPDSISLLSGATTVVPVMNNDSDPEGGSLTAPVITQDPKNGVATVVGNTISYTANANFIGKDTLIYQVCEAVTGCPKPILCDTAIVVFMVTNRPPLAVNDSTITGKCQSVFIPVLNNDSDPEGGSLQLSITTPPANGTASVVNGTQILYTPNSGYTGTDSVGYTITDDGMPALSASAKAIITISASVVNNAPVAGDDEESGVIGLPVYVDILSNDSDPDNDALVVSFPSDILQPKHGTVSFEGFPSVLKYVPAPGFVGKDTFEYKICDSLMMNGCPAPPSLCAVARVIVTIGVENTTNGINDQNNTWINTPVSGNVLTNDFDVEGDAQTFGAFLDASQTGTIANGSTVPGTSFNGVAISNAGTLNYSANGDYTFTPAANFTGSVKISYSVCDASLTTPPVCDTAFLMITVDSLPNQAPLVFADNDEQIVYDGGSNAGNVLQNDKDPQGLNLAVTGYLYQAADGGTPTLNGSLGTEIMVGGKTIDDVGVSNAGKLTLNADGSYVFAATNGFSGTVDVLYTVCNNASSTACKTQTLRITVLPNLTTGNRRPFAGDDFGYTTRNVPVAGSFVNNDSDPDNNIVSLNGISLNASGPHTAIGSAVTTAQGGQVQFYADGTYLYTPPANYAGPDRVVYTLCDVTTAAPQPLCANATINFLIAPGFSITGKVWDDANGNLQKEAGENGTNGSGLYVNLIDAANKVVMTSAVNNDGAYAFTNITPGKDYTLVLTKNNGLVGNTAPAKSLFSNWVYLGENLNGTLETVTPGTIAIASRYTDAVNFDFAIEQLPNSDLKSYSLNFIPSTNQKITLNGSGSVPGKLTGSDPEDGVLQAGNNVVITTVPATGQLYYNGVLVTNGFAINNYNPALLEYKFVGGGYSNCLFYYAFVDAAGQQDPTPASYTITWGGTLAAQDILLTAVPQQSTINLRWDVHGETGVKEYVVERSLDAASFRPVVTVVAHNNGQWLNTYLHTDNIADVNGTVVYYRIRQTAIDGRTMYSAIVPVRLQKSNAVSLWPTVFSSKFTITYPSGNVGAVRVTMVDNAGKLVRLKTVVLIAGLNTIEINDLSPLPAGTYHVTVEEMTKENRYQFHVMKM